MKIILLILLASIPIRAEDWIVEGKAYSDVKVVKVEADCVTILDSDGGARIELSKLSPELQKKFNYDPSKAQVAANKRASEMQASQDLLQAESTQAAQLKQAVLVAEEEARQKGMDKEALQAATQSSSWTDLSRGGTAPVAAPYPHVAAIAPPPEAPEVTSQSSHATARVIQVVPEGFIGVIFTKWGSSDPGFVKCDSKSMIDNQAWKGDVVPFGTYKYTTALGAMATISAFNTNVAQASAPPSPDNHVYVRMAGISGSAGGGQ